MKLLIGLLAVVLVFTACGHLSFKPPVKKPATTTVPKNEQPVTTPPVTLQAAANAKVTIVPPPEIASGNGIAGASYLFTVANEGVPAGAKYSWFVDDKPGGAGDQSMFTFGEAKSYTIRVAVSWTDAGGATQTAENSIAANIQSMAKPATGATTQTTQTTQTTSDSVQVMTQGEPSLTLEIPSGAGGPGVAYTFVAKPVNIPSGARYTWFIDSINVKAGGIDELTAYAPPNFFTGGRQYSVMVEATWKSGTGSIRTATSNGTFMCAGTATTVITVPTPAATPSLLLSIPSGASGPGVPYRFIARPVNIPAGALYTWYINGQDVHSGGIDEITSDAPAGFFTGGSQYSVTVVAEWRNSAGTMLSARADGVFYCSR